MKIKWKEVLKFLSGMFFATAGVNWYLSWNHIAISFFGIEISSGFLAVRGFIHFAFFLITFYFGFIRKSKNSGT